MKRAVLICPGNTVEPTLIAPDSEEVHIESEQRQLLVGGYPEVIPHGHPNLTAFCDEDGWAKGLLINELATALFCTPDSIMLRQPIVGNVLVMGPTVNGKTQGLTVEQVNIFLSPEGEDILNALVETNQ